MTTKISLLAMDVPREVSLMLLDFGLFVVSVLIYFSFFMQELVLTSAMAKRGLDTIRSLWIAHADGSLKIGSSVTLVGSCVTVRAGRAGKLLFIELLDGSTVRTLQCICDSTPDGEAADPRAALDWTPLFESGRRGATVELTGTLESSPAAGQPIEMVVQSFKCLGSITLPESYFLSGKVLCVLRWLCF